jgi:hypothetical protein
MINNKYLSLVLLLSLLSLAGVQAASSENLEQGFVKPPNDAKPWVYWWFQGGYGDPQGMARDLTAMKEKGIGGVMHMQTLNAGGLPLPAQPKMLSPEWDAWFGEAVRLAREAGLTMSASIVDGWSFGGGWVGKEDGAKQLVYVETQMDGPGAIAEPLPMPVTRLGVYHDVAVVAFKEKAMRPPVPLSVSANNVAGGYCGQQYWPAAHATDNDPETFWKIRVPCSKEKPALLDCAYARPITATGALIVGMPKAGPAECEIQVSDGGKVFRPVTQITLVPGEQKRVQFPAVTAKYFRLAISRAHAPDLQLAEFQLLRAGDEPTLRPGIKCWDLKSANMGGGWGGWPKNLYQALEEEYVGADASDVAAADAVDISSHLQADGRLDWTFPAGRWTVMRFGWTPVGEGARMGNGGGYEVDVLNTKGADLMMDNAGKGMREASVKHAGGEPIIFHTDSWEIGAGNKGQQPTWTDDFRQQFQKRRGYDLISYLPAMARRIVNGRQITNRFLRDYRDTVADLLAAYYGRLQERAHQMKGGMNSESGYGSFPHPHMDGLQIFGRSDRPMAEFWHPFPRYSFEYLELVDVMRTAASGARIYGNRFVQAETLTFGRVHGQFTAPEAYRRTLHEAWARGLNQAVIHKYTHQPFEDKPGMMDYDIFNRHMAWWPLADGFLGYIGRCQYLLQQGDFVADAAYFVGEGASRFVPGKAFLNPALPAGYDYDGINAEVFQTRASVQDGRLVLPDGPSYRYLVLCDPQCSTMTPATLAKMCQLVEAGMTLVGKRPLQTPGLGNLEGAEAELKTQADALWGSAPSEEAGERKVGKGRVVWGKPLADILLADGVAPDCGAQAQGKPFDLSWIHRKTGSEDIYFLANPQNAPVDLSVSVRSKGKVVALFDPLNGSSRELPEKSLAADGRTTVPLHFEANQAFFIVLREGKQETVTGKNFPELKPVLTLEGSWNVTFDAQWVKPRPSSIAAGSKEITMVFDTLTDWINRPEEGIKGYSGLAIYRKTFDLPAGIAAAKAACIDLGVAKEMARVELNGRDLGVAWCPPWQMRIPSDLLKARENILVITVANNWCNRLCIDKALPENERLTRIGDSLLAAVAKRELQPAGLIGPVRVLVAE